jgi:LPS export ABC transporter protein LptC
MYSAKQYSIGFLLLLSTAFSTWLALKSSPLQTDDNAYSKNSADSLMTNVRVMRTNSDDGKLQNELFAAQMIHFPNNITTFTQPHVIFYHNTDQPWHLTAQNGQAQEGVTLIKLWNNVILHQPAGTQNQPITITTSEVIVHPKQHTAETNQPVVAIEPGVHVSAIGMHADFKTQIVDLLSQVQVTYQAQNGAKPTL